MMLAVTATHKQVLAVMPNGWVGALHGTPGKFIEVMLVHCPASHGQRMVFMACNLWLKAPKRQFNSCPSIRFGSFGNAPRLYYHIATAIYSWTSFYHSFTMYFGVHLPRVVINRHNIHVQMNHSFRSCRAQDSIVNHRNLKGDNSDPKCL